MDKFKNIMDILMSIIVGIQLFVIIQFPFINIYGNEIPNFFLVFDNC
jgi:L-lactate permease